MSKLVKFLSFLLLVIFFTLFFFSGNKDLILLIFLLILNGALSDGKKDKILYSIVFAFFLGVNFIQEFVPGRSRIGFYFYILILFVSNFLAAFIVGILFKRFFQKKEVFFNLTVLWLFAFSIAQSCVSVIDKKIIDKYNFIVLIIFLIVFLGAGMYVKYFTSILSKFFYFLIIPIILLPIIYFTSKNPYEPIIFLINIVVASVLGFLVSKIKLRNSEKL